MEIVHAENRAAELASLHAECFPRPWSAAEMNSLNAVPGTFTLAAATPHLQGMIIVRSSGESADLITLAVRPQARRRGIGQLLLATALMKLANDGARQMLLEVAQDNLAAIKLYENNGFKLIHRRPAYYGTPGQERTDALVMRCLLAEPS